MTERRTSLLTTYAGGHLGALVAPLVDGELRPGTAERAWAHVLRCRCCTEAVRRQTWVKNQLLLSRSGHEVAPSASLADRLCALPDSLAGDELVHPSGDATGGAWPPRTRLVAAAGVGGLSAAAFVVASLVGLPAVDGPSPVGADLGVPAATSGGPGAAVVDAVDLDRQRRATRP